MAMNRTMDRAARSTGARRPARASIRAEVGGNPIERRAVASSGARRGADLPLKLRKARFLDKLRSAGKLDYKRYLASPLRYAGGKSLAVGLVVERLPDDVSRVASPFIGGGSVEVAIARELGLPVAAYDVFDILCAWWRAQLSAPSALARRLRAFRPDRETFARVKRWLEAHWKRGDKLGEYDLAAH